MSSSWAVERRTARTPDENDIFYLKRENIKTRVGNVHRYWFEEVGYKTVQFVNYENTCAIDGDANRTKGIEKVFREFDVRTVKNVDGKVIASLDIDL